MGQIPPPFSTDVFFAEMGAILVQFDPLLKSIINWELAILIAFDTLRTIAKKLIHELGRPS